MSDTDILKTIPTEEFLRFLREKFRNMIIHNSNVFFRDIHYGMMGYLASKGSKAGHDDAEGVARGLVSRLVGEGVLTEIDRQSWRVNYPSFALPRVEKPAAPAAAPKPAAAPAAAAAPAGSTAPAAPAAAPTSAGA